MWTLYQDVVVHDCLAFQHVFHLYKGTWGNSNLSYHGIKSDHLPEQHLWMCIQNFPQRWPKIVVVIVIGRLITYAPTYLQVLSSLLMILEEH